MFKRYFVDVVDDLISKDAAAFCEDHSTLEASLVSALLKVVLRVTRNVAGEEDAFGYPGIVRRRGREKDGASQIASDEEEWTASGGDSF